jgi:hypothetical protein
LEEKILLEEDPVAFEVREQYLRVNARTYKWKIFDAVYLAFLVGLGILLWFTLPNERSETIIGFTLINASTVALAIFVWPIFSGPVLFKRRNIFRTFIAILLLIIGVLIIIFQYDSAPGAIVIASIFSVALLFLISKAFLLIEDSEVYANTVLQELKTTRSSLSHGLAMGYFYNFLVPVCESISNETVVEVEKGRGDMVKTSLSHPYFFVVIPSSLPEDKIKESVANGIRDKHFYSCKIMNPQQHRPMFFNLVSWNQETATSDGLFDIPTTIGTLINFARLESPKDYSIEMEITKFQNVLVFLIAKHPHIAEKIRIISIQWPINYSHLNAAIREAISVYPPEFAPGLTLSPTQSLNDWLSTVEDVIDRKDEEE